MSLKAEIIEVHAKHPRWSHDAVAVFVGASPSFVRKVAHKQQLAFGPKNPFPAKTRFRKAGFAGRPHRGPTGGGQ